MLQTRTDVPLQLDSLAKGGVSGILTLSGSLMAPLSRSTLQRMVQCQKTIMVLLLQLAKKLDWSAGTLHLKLTPGTHDCPYTLLPATSGALTCSAHQ